MRTALPTCGLRPPPPTRLHRLLRSEEEEGSEEGEGSDEEHVEATPAPRSSAKKAKPKSTTPASRKAASRRSSMADEDLLDEGVELAATSLVDCYEQLVSAPVRVGQPSMLLSMSLDKWSQLYTADAARAIVDVLNLFLRVCGLPESRLDLADVDAVRAPPCPYPRISAPAPAPPLAPAARPLARACARPPPAPTSPSRSIPHPPRWPRALALLYSQALPSCSTLVTGPLTHYRRARTRSTS